MFLVMDFDPNTDSSKERSGDATSSFLQIAYSKARSMTGVSLTSTDASSIASANVDPMEVSLDASSRAVPLEDIEESFYECRSQHGSTSDLAALSTSTIGDHVADEPPKQVDHRDEIVTYRNGMCVYADGTPATQAPPGHCISKVPYEFEEFHDFDLKKAKKMWEAALKWREENEVWKIHRKPNKQFQRSKEYYPSCYHGLDKEGCVVEFSYPGKMQPDKLFPNATALDDMMRHHMFMQEYLFNCLYTDEQSWRQLGREPLEVNPSESTTNGIVLVVDVTDCGVNLLSGKVFTFMKRMIHNSTSYYPEMLKCVVLINSPFWVAGVFSTIKPLLPDALPVEIVSAKNTYECLRRYCDEDEIPVEYGGNSPYPLHQHPFEKRLHHKAKVAANYGVDPDEPPLSTIPPTLTSTLSTPTIVTSNKLETAPSEDETAQTPTSTSTLTAPTTNSSLERTESEEETACLSDRSSSLDDALAKEFVLAAASDLDFPDHDRLERICDNMQEEHIVRAWQLQHLDASEFKSLDFPLGLASAVRRKVLQSNPYDDGTIESLDLLSPSPPCFNPFRAIAKGLGGCRR